MDKIRKALADGQELSFAHLEGRGKHLKIDWDWGGTWTYTRS
jgi:hypothetical protein